MIETMKPFLFALLESVGMNALADETPDLKFGVISDIFCG